MIFNYQPIKLKLSMDDNRIDTGKLLLTSDCMNVDTNKINQRKRDEMIKTFY
jgi:hypothetical protein